MGRLVQQPPPARTHRQHPAGRSRGKLLCSHRGPRYGRLTQAKWPPAIPGRFNARLDSLLLQRIPEPFGIVSSVGQHPLRFGHVVQQGSGASVITDLTCGDEEAERPTIRIVSAWSLMFILGSSDQAPEIPIFTPRLDAVRRAFRWVASIMTVVGSARSAA